MPPPPPQKSKTQAWVEICEAEDLMADALVYFGRRGNDWFDIYKALECLELKFGPTEAEFEKLGWAPPGEYKRLKRTANDGRHAQKNSHHTRTQSHFRMPALLASLIRRGSRNSKAALMLMRSPLARDRRRPLGFIRYRCSLRRCRSANLSDLFSVEGWRARKLVSG